MTTPCSSDTLLPILLSFVDSIPVTGTAQTVLDLNDGTWCMSGDTQFPPPDLDRAVVSTLLTDGERYPASVYRNRVLNLVLSVQAASADELAEQMQRLWKQLDKPRNYLLYQPKTSLPVYFRTFRTSAKDIRVIKREQNSAIIAVDIPADPFAYGPKTSALGDIGVNGTFESNIDDWQGVNASVALSNTVAHSGTYSMRITPNGGSATVSANTITRHPVTAGGVYTWTIWVYSPAGWSDVRAAIDWYDASNTFLSTTLPSATAISAGVWTQLTTTANVPAGASKAVPRVRMGATPTATDILYTDDLTLTQTGQITNDPAVNQGMHIDLTGIKGDVETPLVTHFNGLNVTSGSGAVVTAVAVRRRGTPSAAPMVLQAETMTVGTDTTVGADASMSGGSYTRTTFATSTSMLDRLSISRFPTASGVDVRGTYRVYARYRKSVAGDAISMRLRWAQVGAAAITGDTIALPTTYTGPALVDLGQISYPVGVDPVTDGPSGVLWPVAGLNISVQAQRVSGSGNLDIDYLLLVPVDDRYCLAAWSRDSGHDFQVLDGYADAVWALDGGAVDRAQPTTLVGGLPLVSPDVTNRLYVVRNAGNYYDGVSFETDSITQTVSLTPYYWPRYLRVAPPVEV